MFGFDGENQFQDFLLFFLINLSVDILPANTCTWPDYRHVPRCIWIFRQEICGGGCMLIQELTESRVVM